MSTDTSTSTTDGNQTSGDTSAAGDEFKAITSQEEFNRLLDERLKRERAKYADYKDVKAKAGRLDEIEESQKSELQKAADKVAAAEREVAAVPTKVAEALRTHLVELHKIPADVADLYLTATEPDLLLKQVAGLQKLSIEQDEQRKKNGNRVPREGTTPPPATDSPLREFARGVFDRSDT